MRITTILAALAFSLTAATALGAETLTVPGDHDTIQEAVNAAGDADTIRVKKGTYREQIVINGKTNLTIQAAGKVVIDAQGQGHAIHAIDSTGIVLSKLRVRGGVDGAIRLQRCDGCTITKCRVENSTFRGISVQAGGNHTIEKTKFNGNTDRNVDLDSDNNVDPSNVTLMKNKFTGGQVGVEMQGNGHVFLQNTIKNTLDHAFRLFTTTNARFEKNKISKPGRNGFRLRGMNNMLINNTVKNALERGAAVEGSGHSFSGDKFIKPVDDGIRVQDGSANVTISDVKVVKPGDEGVQISGDGHVVERTSVTKAGMDAFRVHGTNTRIEDCRAKKSGVNDLSDVSGSGTNDFINNGFDPDKIEIII